MSGEAPLELVLSAPRELASRDTLIRYADIRLHQAARRRHLVVVPGTVSVSEVVGDVPEFGVLTEDGRLVGPVEVGAVWLASCLTRNRE